MYGSGHCFVLVLRLVILMAAIKGMLFEFGVGYGSESACGSGIAFDLDFASVHFLCWLHLFIIVSHALVFVLLRCCCFSLF